MSRSNERIARAAEQAEQDGYHRESDGRFVDPLPVQKVAIEEGFRKSADELTFDIWSLVDWDRVAREGDTLAENFERVVDEFKTAVDKPGLEQRVRELIEQQKQESDTDE